MNLIAIDYETYLISNEQVNPKPVCLSFYNGQDKGLLVGLPEIGKFLYKILNSDLTIIAHNMRFEALVTYEHFPELREALINKLQKGELMCTKVYESLINNTRKQPLRAINLAACVQHYFQTDISESKKSPDAWRLRYHELEGVQLKDWPQEAVDYAIDDSVWAYKVFKQQLKVPLEVVSSIKADFYLNLMANNGLIVDKERVKLLKQELLAKITPKYMNLEKHGLTTYENARTSKRSGKFKPAKFKKNLSNLQAFVSKHVKDIEKSPKGGVSTSGESLEKYVLQDGTSELAKEVFTDYLEIMKYEKILTSFVSRLEKANPLIRTTYNPVVSSGRTSSSGSDLYPSVNIQQMPRGVDGVTWDIRNCFVPRPGYVICSIDYSGLELAATAHQLKTHTSRCEMADMLNSSHEPVDMHSMLAYRIMNRKEKTNITYEEFANNKKIEPYKSYRQLAKPINLGFPGGIGYDTMRSLLAREGIYPRLEILETEQYENRLSWKVRQTRDAGYPTRIRRTGFAEYQLIYDELVALKQEMFRLYPDLEEFLTDGHHYYLTGETKAVKNEFGEWEKEPVYKFETNGFQHDWCTYTQFCNGLMMQSPAAIGAKKATCAIIEYYRNNPNVIPLAFIHDEIVFEVKQNDEMYAIIDHVSMLMVTQMQSVLTSVKIAVEAEVFPYWKKSGGDWSKTYWVNPNDPKVYSK